MKRIIRNGKSEVWERGTGNQRNNAEMTVGKEEKKKRSKERR